MSVFNINCFQNLSIRKLFCSCMKSRTLSQEEEEQQQNTTNRPRANTNSNVHPIRTIVFSKLPNNIDYSNLLNNTMNNNVTFVFNLDNNIICAGSQNIITNLFNADVGNIVGKNLGDLNTINVPIPVIKILNDIIDGVKRVKKRTGCIIDIDSCQYICVGFPIIEDLINNNLVGVLISKQLLNESVLKNDDILGIDDTHDIIKQSPTQQTIPLSLTPPSNLTPTKTASPLKPFIHSQTSSLNI